MSLADDRRRPGRSGARAVVVLGLLLAACEVSPTPSPSVVPSGPPFVGSSYPLGAPADCAYGGEIAQIEAVDRLTVTFSLCYPDAAFLSKVAMPTNGIQDSDWLTRHAPDGSIRLMANGTGPYTVADGAPATGDQVTLHRYDGYWGRPAVTPQVVFEWSAVAETRLRNLTLGTVDGIDGVGASELATIRGEASLQVQERAALNTLSIGLTNTFAPFDSLEIRRALAVGIDRQAIVDDLLPPGSSLAQYVAPCSIAFACAGDAWYGRDAAVAREVLGRPGFPGRWSTHIYYADAAGCALTDLGPVARELQTQLKDDLGVDADLRVQPVATFTANLSAGLLDGLWLFETCPAYPDVSAFLDPELDNPDSQQFGIVDSSISAALRSGRESADSGARQAAYRAANDAIRLSVPMIPIAHVGSATAWRADVTGALASPLDAESFASMDPGGRPRLVWMQSSSPRSFYCADQADADTLRLCQSVFEQLYAFKPGTAEPTPGLAESCEPNEQLTVWTCHLRSGVTFHDGSVVDANDVLLSFAAQWDLDHPLHIGRASEPAGWSAAFGPLLNAPPPTP